MAGYSIDTSSLIEGWHRRYPMDVFPGLWDALSGLIDDGSLRAAEEVGREIEKKDDDLCKWLKARPALLIAIDEPTQFAMRQVVGANPRIVGQMRGRNVADPWVIALAIAYGLTVVTNERAAGTPERPRIPDVCTSLGVSCINMLEFIRSQGWRFGLSHTQRSA